MKKIFLVTICSLLSISIFGQSAKEMMDEMDGKYNVDDNGNVTYVKVIESPDMSKDEIFIRVQNYFTYNYGSGKAVIQTNDKDNGVLVGKGMYSKVHVGVSILTTTVDAWHILRVDVKDGKARAIITLTQYETIVTGGDKPTYSTIDVSSTYPINPKGANKTVMTKALYKSTKAALDTLDKLEKAIQEGNTSSDIENSDW